MLNGKSILITGGTGSFGQEMVRQVLAGYTPKRLIIFSRDELKQYEMAQRYSPSIFRCLRYFIGDVRDRQRLYRAFDGIDVVIHAAALKHVPLCEYNPLEAVKTNILGAENVIDAAIDRGVKQVVALSTDKAVNPVNLYGATKLCSDKLFIAANQYAGHNISRFCVVRYGNVIASRGSVIPLFLRKKRDKEDLPVTDERMTRFWITLGQAVEFVLRCLENMTGGETFVPKIPSLRILDLAKAIAPECAVKVIGIRPGEKLHEVMVPLDDAARTLDFQDHFVILPSFYDLNKVGEVARSLGARTCKDAFSYRSDNNHAWLSVDDLKTILADLEFSE